MSRPMPRHGWHTALLAACLLLPIHLPTHAENGDTRTFHLGGAARFNYAWRDYGPSTQFQPELVRLSASGQFDRLFGSAQYRWYDGYNMVHHAWLGWKLGETSDIRAGVLQVPFAMLPYAAQSFWFNTDYYLGLDDDYDLGIVFQHQAGQHHWHIGVFFGDEYGDSGRFDRYSFDVADTPDFPYREHGQLNLRHEYQHEFGDYALKYGSSLRLGRLEDRREGGHEPHLAAALHTELARGNFTAQAQWIYYHYDVPGNRLALSAFAAPFEIAAKAHVPSVNFIYQIPRSGWLDSITCYNNYSATLVSGSGLRNSQQNVTGCMFGKDKALLYVDWIAGYNMWFINGPGIGIQEPGHGRWHSRLNINLGFYF